MSSLLATGVPHVHLLDAGLKGAPQYTGIYLIDTEQPTIVDAGFSYSVPAILAGLKTLNVAPGALRYIVLTHVHMDHAGGAGGLIQACPNAKVIVHERGAKHLVEPQRLVDSVQRAVGKLFDRYGTMVPIAKDRIQTVSGGETIELGQRFTLKLVDAPGHAPHQYCAFVPEHGALFVADACGIYCKALGRLITTTPPPAFFLGASLETLNALKKLAPQTLLFPHFGAHDEPQLIDEYADLLTRWVTAVEDAYDTLQDFEATQRHFVRKLSPQFIDQYDEVMLQQEIEMNVMGVLLYFKRQREG